MIDWTRVTELRDEVGADDFDEVVELFLDEVEESLAPLRDDPNCATPSQVLHALKGAAWNLGFRQWGEICEALEHACDGAPMDLSPVVQTYDKARAQFLSDLPRQSWAA